MKDMATKPDWMRVNQRVTDAYYGDGIITDIDRQLSNPYVFICWDETRQITNKTMSHWLKDGLKPTTQITPPETPKPNVLSTIYRIDNADQVVEVMIDVADSNFIILRDVDDPDKCIFQLGYEQANALVKAIQNLLEGK